MANEQQRRRIEEGLAKGPANLNEGKREQIEQVIATTDDDPTQIDQIAEIRGWFRPKEDNTPYPIIQEYLNGAIDLGAAISKITAPIDEAITAGKRTSCETSSLEPVAYSVLHSAKRISYRDAEGHAKLVDLVKALKEHPEPAPNYEDYGGYYSTLSVFGLAFREAYNDAPRDDLGVFPAETHAWANFNYFLARLTYCNVLERYLYAIWAMREALERTPDPLPGWYDAHTPAAAMWALGLREKLYEKEEDLTPEKKNQGNPAAGGDLWNGGPVLSKDRWAFWKQRFGEVTTCEDVREETRNIAKEAVEAMEKAENP